MDLSEYVTTTEYARRHGVSRQLVHRLIRQGRLDGARPVEIMGVRRWLVPRAAPYPVDPRKA